MKNYHSISLVSRFFDLDSQHHINNASYLSYAREGQFLYLQNLGYSFEYLAAKKLFLKPQLIQVSFIRQQLSQVPLEVHTKVNRVNNNIYFDQRIYNHETRELSVQLATRLAVEKNLLDKIDDGNEELLKSFVSPGILKNFSENCNRSLMEYRIRHIDLDGFGQCADIVLWRLNEEARWNFMNDINVPFENLKENDLSLFWINGFYHYDGDVQLNDTLKIYTWIGKLDKVRIYIRQEIIKNDLQRVLYTEGEFLTVSLSRLKPVRIPEFLKIAFSTYTEKVQ